jgi:hypothetical protein
MLTDSLRAELYYDWHAYIDDENARDAFCYIVGLAATLRSFGCYPKAKGEVKDFRFEDEYNAIRFAFIVNKSWLLFYFRKPAIESGKYSQSDLRNAFETARETEAGEWTIRLQSVDDVKRLWRLLAIC